MSIDIAERKGALLRRLLRSADRLSESAIARELRFENTPFSSVNALLVLVTRADHRDDLLIVVRFLLLLKRSARTRASAVASPASEEADCPRYCWLPPELPLAPPAAPPAAPALPLAPPAAPALPLAPPAAPVVPPMPPVAPEVPLVPPAVLPDDGPPVDALEPVVPEALPEAPEVPGPPELLEDSLPPAPAPFIAPIRLELMWRSRSFFARSRQASFAPPVIALHLAMSAW